MNNTRHIIPETGGWIQARGSVQISAVLTCFFLDFCDFCAILPLESVCLSPKEQVVKAKFNLLLSDHIPVPAAKIPEGSEIISSPDASGVTKSHDGSDEKVEIRRTKLLGDLAIECIHAHAFLNALNATTGIDPRFEKVRSFVHNRFIKKTVQLHSDLDTKKTIMSAVRHGLEQLKIDCNQPNFSGALDRLCLDSATKYEDLLNANIVYVGTDERIQFADYVHSKGVGLSTIITHDMMGEDEESILREKVVGICVKWIDSLYGGMKTHKTPQKSGVWPGWTPEEHRHRNWFEWTCDTVGNTLITLGNYVKVSKPDKTDKKSSSEHSASGIEITDSRIEF